MAAGVRDRTAARRRRLTLSGSLASQTLSVPQRRALSAFSMRADTKSDRCCGTETVWFAR